MTEARDLVAGSRVLSDNEKVLRVVGMTNVGRPDTVSLYVERPSRRGDHNIRYWVTVPSNAEVFRLS